MNVTYDTAFKRLIGHEGKFTNNPKDRGNWTSGQIGVGQLKGTKYGISAMSYPDEDIANLSLDRAKFLYKRDFWEPVTNNSFHTAIEYQMFDAAVNHGVGNAIRLLQRAVGVVDDGDIGPVTEAAVKAHSVDDVLKLYSAERIVFFSNMTAFDTFGKGWVRRVAQNLRYAASDYTAPWYEQLDVE